jgi:hypothetical protein
MTASGVPQEVRPFIERGGGDYDPGAFRSWVSMLGEQARRNQVSEALAKSRGRFGFGLACVLTVAGMPANCRRHAS